MRVVYLHQYFTTPQMAGGTRSFELARRLVGWGHEVHMITADTDPSTASARGGWYQTQEAGIDVHWLPVPYGNATPYRARLEAFATFALAAARRAAQFKADVVFASSTPLTIALPAVYAARRGRVPMVFEVRDLWPDVPIALGALNGWPAVGSARALERLAYRHASHVVALSPGMKAGVVRQGYPEGRVHVIPNSADLELFDVPAEAGRAFRGRYAWLQERPLVVYTGTLGQVNGVGYLARLAAAVYPLAPEVRFLVVGEGREEAEVRALAQRLGVLDVNFFMLGRVPKRAVPEILSAATLATSLVIDVRALHDNSANKFFDALAAGRPFAVNHEGWLADLLRRHGAGLVLDPHDLAAASRALLSALNDPHGLAEAGKRARELAETHFARDTLAKALETVLLRAVNERSHRVPQDRSLQNRSLRDKSHETAPETPYDAR